MSPLLHTMIAWALLTLSGVFNLLLGRAIVDPFRTTSGRWQDIPCWRSTVRLLIATAGASALSSDVNALEPRWLGVLVVALPCFVLGLLWGRVSVRQSST